MSRNKRQPMAIDNPHSLIARVDGVNRFRPGMYLCKCGASFTGIHPFEQHRAEANREETQSE